MIGVLAAPAQRDAAEELFQLFKTPWEFARPDRQYEVVLTTSGELPDRPPRLLLLSGPDPVSADGRFGFVLGASSTGGTWRGLKYELPLYGNVAPVQGVGQSLVDNGQGSSVVMGQRQNDCLVIRFGFDLLDETAKLLREGQPASRASTPTLDLHVEFLRELILNAGIAVVEIPPAPDGHAFIACLTHDIDHPTIRPHRWDHTLAGFLRRALIDSPIAAAKGRLSPRKVLRNYAAATRLPFVQLGLSTDWWQQFDQYAGIEQGSGSTFFVIPRRGDPGRALDSAGPAPFKRAAAYSPPDIKPQLDRLQAAGCEIALHGLDAWADAGVAQAERASVARATPNGEVGVRMHWLYFDHGSPARLEAAGFTYDSTFGYNDTIGYRAGTAQAYRPLGLEQLLELPLHIMDTALFYPSYLNLSDTKAAQAMTPLIEFVSQNGGALTINWHDRSLFPERLWGDSYIALLERLRERGAWLTTAANGVAWFRARRAATFSLGAQNHVAVATGPQPAGLPGFRLRRHAPREGLLRNPMTLDFDRVFSDEPVTPVANASMS